MRMSLTGADGAIASMPLHSRVVAWVTRSRRAPAAAATRAGLCVQCRQQGELSAAWACLRLLQAPQRRKSKRRRQRAGENWRYPRARFALELSPIGGHPCVAPCLSFPRLAWQPSPARLHAPARAIQGSLRQLEAPQAKGAQRAKAERRAREAAGKAVQGAPMSAGPADPMTLPRIKGRPMMLPLRTRAVARPAAKGEPAARAMTAAAPAPAAPAPPGFTACRTRASAIPARAAGAAQRTRAWMEPHRAPAEWAVASAHPAQTDNHALRGSALVGHKASGRSASRMTTRISRAAPSTAPPSASAA